MSTEWTRANLKNQPIWHLQTVGEIVSRQLSTPRQSTALLGAFAMLALILAALGLYGVLSYAITLRTNEIGVRLALGATRGGILLSFVKSGLTLTLAGMAIGSVLSVVAARSVSVLLFDFQPNYAQAIASVSLMLMVVAAIGCLVPARRASRVDPLTALRSE